MNNLNGLNSKEARERLLKFGPNQIFKPTKISFLGIFKEEVTEPMILLLLVVGFFYSLWGKLEDAVTIFVVITALISAEVYNEFRAKKAIASLVKIAALKTKVLRDGEITETDTENVVPGDMLVLTVGTKISADAQIQSSIGLEIDESSLTGESFPQEKKEGQAIFAGTIVVSGEGKAEVATTGIGTKLGKMAASLKQVKPPKTKLQLAMKALAGKLLYIAAFFSIVIPLLGILRGQDLRIMILTGLSLAFAIIPEELPIVITMVLGLGAYNLSKHKFLVKKIKAAETLGNATVILTDKTGTITESQMKIVSLYPDDREKIMAKALGSLSEYVFSPLEQEIKNKAKEWKIKKVFSQIIRQRNLGNGKKTKAVIRKTNQTDELFVSGAPEEIFAGCRKITDETKNELIKEVSQGRRVIAVACKKLKPNERDLNFAKLEREMEFIGLIGFEDPPRIGVKETIAQAAKAGIRTIMVTGDHPLTAGYIAKEVGIENPGDLVLTGEDLDKLSDGQIEKTVREVSVFARSSPEHKYRIVRALQKNREIVAVTGDGVNDALALKGADIGIAMGIKDIFIKGGILFAGVMAIYLFARSQKLTLKEAQTYAFSAWIFGHIILAFVSRSDKESLFSIGIFTNRIINLWALTATGLLLLGIYLPFLNDRFNLRPISAAHLLLIASIMILILGILEVKKFLKLRLNLKSFDKLSS